MPRGKKQLAAEPGPIVCAEVGSLPLYRIENLDGSSVNRLALKGITTLAHLAERVERVAAETPREALLTVLGAVGLRDTEKAEAADAILGHLAPTLKGATDAHAEAAAEGGRVGGRPAPAPGGGGRVDPPAGAAPGGGVGEGAPVGPGPRPYGRDAGACQDQGRPDVAHDFAEGDPPPRRHPVGDPAPRYLELPPGESALGTYKLWYDRGRIAERSVLCDYRGTEFGTRSGYVVAANPTGPGTRVQSPLGPVGTAVPEAALEGWRVACVLVERPGRRVAVVVSPEG